MLATTSTLSISGTTGVPSFKASKTTSRGTELPIREASLGNSSDRTATKTTFQKSFSLEEKKTILESTVDKSTSIRPVEIGQGHKITDYRTPTQDRCSRHEDIRAVLEISLEDLDSCKMKAE